MSNNEAKPVLKWAGGKSKLIPEIESRFPKDIEKEITTYIEPFIGGGAVFFHIMNEYKFKKVIINDINKELVLMYKVLKEKPYELIEILERKQNEYNNLNSIEEKSELFYSIREEFNKGKGSISYDIIDIKEVEHASYMIFLNKSCFNGLYRENKKGLFNVPFGKKEKINTFEKTNILSASNALQDVIILNGDFEGVERYINDKSFIYMDPPYRPLKKDSFTDYSREEFNDNSQKRLAELCERINKVGAKFIQSNSDPKNTNEDDEFFDELYKQFKIDRIKAARNINSKGTGRGKVSELLIKNY